MSKLKTLDFLVNFSKQKKKKGKKIVLCHGVFDFPHLGHVNHFNAAKKFGDYLIVSVTEDKPCLIDNNLVTSPHYKYVGEWMKGVINLHKKRK